MDIQKELEVYADDHLRFKDVTEKLSSRPDLCAFLILERLIPNETGDIISASEHDEIYIDVDVKKLEKVATEEDIRNLVACGVMYDEENDSLSMFT